MFLSPNWMLSRGRSVKHFFSKCFEQSTSWCFGSHFFVARSHRFIAICHCRFLASFFFSFFFFFFFLFWNEKHGKKTPLSTFHCNQLRHTRSACFKTDLPDYFDSLLFKSYWAMRVMRDFQLQTTQMLEASCLFSFKSILLRTSGKCQSIKRTACILNFIYIVQSKWYLRLKISVQGPFNVHRNHEAY